MKNYRKLHYEKYYAPNKRGDLVLVNRAECFTPGEQPTAANPFKQRCFFDPEGKIAIRLERNKQGEEMHRMNASSLKKEERYIKSKLKCIGEQTKDCDGNCNYCNRYISRTLELDKPLGGGEEIDSEIYYELPSPTLTPETILINKETTSALKKAIIRLTPKQQQLIYLRFIQDKTLAEIADLWGISRQAVNKQFITAKTALKNILKNFE